MVFLHAKHLLVALLALVSTASANHAEDEPTTYDNGLPIPFYLRNDESGLIVAVVVFGPGPEDERPVFCRESPDPFTGPNVMQCRKVPNHNSNYYELQIPFSFERDPSTGSIVRVNFLESGEHSVIPFTLYNNEEGQMVAVVNDEGDVAKAQLTIPYRIQRDDSGDITAVVLTGSDDHEETIPMHYRTNSDGSVSVVYFGDDVDQVGVGLTGGQKFAIVVGCFFGASLAVVAWKVWSSCCGRARAQKEDVAKPTGQQVPPVV